MKWDERYVTTFLGDFVAHADFQAELLETNGYEVEVEMMARKFVRPGMTVANIGANIGYFTRLLSNLVGLGGSVHAVEPHPDNAALLRRNTNDDIVTIYESAVSTPDATTATLHEHPANSGEHSLLLSNADTLVVPCIDLHTLPALDFAIVDTQGFDLAAMVALGDHRPPAAVVEYWQEGADALGMTRTQTFDMYRQMGYRVTPLPDNTNVLLSTTC